MNVSPFIKEHVENEVKAFADAVLHIENYIQPHLQKISDIKLDLDLILKKFIKFLKFSLLDSSSKVNIYLFLTI